MLTYTTTYVHTYLHIPLRGYSRAWYRPSLCFLAIFPSSCHLTLGWCEARGDELEGLGGSHHYDVTASPPPSLRPSRASIVIALFRLQPTKPTNHTITHAARVFLGP